MPQHTTPPFVLGQKLHCAIESLGFGGSGIAKPQGFAIFVPKTMPGDELWIEIIEVKRRFAFAIPVEWTLRSARRVAPPCVYFDQCGGCHVQHISTAEMGEIKTQQLIETFQKISKALPPILRPMFHPKLTLGYRNKTTYQVREDGTKGYVAIDRSTLLPIDTCKIASPKLDQVWQDLDRRLKGPLPDIRYITLRETTTGQVAAIFSTESNDPQRFSQSLRPKLPTKENLFYYLAPIPKGHFSPYDKELITLEGPSTLVERFGELEYHLSPTDFFQVHPESAAHMLGLANAWQEKHRSEKILDLYCGVGFFSLSLAGQGAKVLGIEISRSSILSAERSAKINRLDSLAHFRTGKASTLVERLYREGQRFDACLIDPPRKGADLEVLEGLKKLGIQRLLYVSCSPASFARDWLRLENEGYRLEETHPLDMFPQTYHTELISSFELS